MKIDSVLQDRLVLIWKYHHKIDIDGVSIIESPEGDVLRIVDNASGETFEIIAIVNYFFKRSAGFKAETLARVYKSCLDVKKAEVESNNKFWDTFYEKLDDLAED